MFSCFPVFLFSVFPVFRFSCFTVFMDRLKNSDGERSGSNPRKTARACHKKKVFPLPAISYPRDGQRDSPVTLGVTVKKLRITVTVTGKNKPSQHAVTAVPASLLYIFL